MKRTSLWEIRERDASVTRTVVVRRKRMLPVGSEAEVQSPTKVKGR